MFASLNLKLIAEIFAACLLIFAGWYPEHLKLVAYKTEVIAAGKAQELHNKQLLQEQKQVTEQVKNDYQKKLNSINSMYARMRQPSSGQVSASPYTSITINGKTYDPISVAHDCALETQKLLSLQEWENSIPKE